MTARAGVELLIALLLLYSFFIVPIELSVWISDDVCSLPPTQDFDMTTEIVFIVISPHSNPRARLQPPSFPSSSASASPSDKLLSSRRRPSDLRQFTGLLFPSLDMSVYSKLH